MWHYAQDGHRKGPVSDQELRRMASEGTLKPSDLVWREGMSDWLPAGEATGFEFGSAAAPAVPEPPSYAQPSEPAAPPRYSQSASPYAPPGAAIDPAAEQIPNYLPWSIAATLLCCWIPGVVAIVFSAQANSAKGVGNWPEARRKAAQAKTWLYVSVGLGLLVIIGYTLLVVAGGLSGEF